MEGEGPYSQREGEAMSKTWRLAQFMVEHSCTVVCDMTHLLGYGDRGMATVNCCMCVCGSNCVGPL